MRIVKYLIISFILLIGINVYAEGPDSNKYIVFGKSACWNDYSEHTYLYSETGTNDSIDGVTYDIQTNTLTFNNYNAEYSQQNYCDSRFFIKNMGNLKIKFIGDNSFKSTCVEGGCRIFNVENTNITMEGSATINFETNQAMMIMNSYQQDGNTNKFAININNLTINANVNSIVTAALFIADSININETTINLNGDVDFSSYAIDDDTITTLNNSKVNAVGGVCSISADRIINSEIDSKYCKLNSDYIKNSRINIIYAFEQGLSFGDADKLVIDNSYISINPITGVELENYRTINSEKLERNYININAPQIAVLGVEKTTGVEITGKSIIEGGQIYKSCGGADIFGYDMCIYYIASEEIPNFVTSYIKVANGMGTQEDIDNLKKLSTNMVISDPVPNQIVDNVPNTGISQIVGIILGTLLFMYGGYLIHKIHKNSVI